LLKKGATFKKIFKNDATFRKWRKKLTACGLHLFEYFIRHKKAEQQSAFSRVNHFFRAKYTKSIAMGSLHGTGECDGCFFDVFTSKNVLYWTFYWSTFPCL